MTDYVKAAARADASLRRKGGVVMLRREVPGERDGAPMPAPTTADLALIGSKVYSIANVVDLQPTDTSLLFTLPLRGV